MYDKLYEEGNALPTASEHIEKTKAKRIGSIAGVAIGIIVIAAGVAAAYGVITATQKHKTDYSYGIMIDGGSAGTRAHIYRWPVCPPGSIPIIETSLSSLKMYEVESGVSAVDLNGTYDIINTIINWASNNVPKHNIPQTPVFFKATGGMRSLPRDEQEKRLNVIREYLHRSQFMFANDSWATVISGDDEGAFGWLSANFATGLLFDKNKTHVGALDMGGSSIQITFDPMGEELKEKGYDLTLPKLDITLYTKSFADLGIDVFLDRLEEEAILSASGQDEAEFPCHLKGYYKKKGNAMIKGTGDSEKCKNVIREALNISAPCPVSPCSLNGAYQPSLAGKGTFYALGSYPYVGNFFELSNVLESSPEDLDKKVMDYCTLTWEEAKNKYPNYEEWLDYYCIEGLYDVILLNEGYGFEYDQKRIVFTEYVDEVPLEWPLGAIIYEITRL